MPEGGLPDEVRKFIRDNVSSIEQLEILLHLYEIAPSNQSSEAIARSLHLSVESVARQLSNFVDKRLISKSTATPPEFSLDSKSSNVGLQIQKLANLYRERRVKIINEIFSNPIDTIQTFADAFIIGRKKE